MGLPELARSRAVVADPQELSSTGYPEIAAEVARRFFKESFALPHPDMAIVTGAFSYTGRYVARRLLDEGVGVRTLTRNPGREDPFGGRVPAALLDFSNPDGLLGSMEGAGVG